MSCEKNAIDSASISPSVPGANDLIWFTLTDGSTIFRRWSTIAAGIAPNDEEHTTIGSGSNTNNFVVGTSQVFLTNFVGRRIRLFRGQVPQLFSLGQFTWNSGTGELNVFPAPSSLEVFLVQSY
jgi:hypothetical protein